jgi:hypothetical protein
MSLLCKEVFDDVAASEDLLAAAVVRESKYFCDGGLALLDILTRLIWGCMRLWWYCTRWFQALRWAILGVC